jgi:hypothetical protein
MKSGKEIGSNVAAMSPADRERSATALRALRELSANQTREYEEHCRLCPCCGKETSWAPYPDAPAKEHVRVVLHCNDGHTKALRAAGSDAVYRNAEASLKNFGVTA